MLLRNNEIMSWLLLCLSRLIYVMQITITDPQTDQHSSSLLHLFFDSNSNAHNFYHVDLPSSSLDPINGIYARIWSNVQQSVARSQVYNESENWSEGKHFFHFLSLSLSGELCYLDEHVTQSNN